MATNTQLGHSNRPRSSDAVEISPGLMLSGFRVEGVLAEGGMATVYAAVHPMIGKRAAIKVISHELSSDAAAVEAFLQEARDANQIRHPNIVDVFAFGSLPDRRSYFVMEWLEGLALRSRLIQGTLSLGESCEILIQVCDALEAVHAKGIVHLDLKPENVFLVPLRGGCTLVKLLDFGIAKFFESDVLLEIRGAATSAPGTPDYMSPEQAQGKQLNQSSDAYSLGVMAFEMFLDRRPFLGESRNALLLDQIWTAPPKPRLLWPQIPAILEELLLGLLAKDPAARTAVSTARTVLIELRDASLRIETVQGEPAVERPVTRKLLSRSKRRSLAAAVIVLLAVLAGGVGWSQLGHGTPLASTAIASIVDPLSTQPAAPAPADRPRVGTLDVTVNAPSARFALDGELVADGTASVRIELNGGAVHRLSVTAHGYRDYQRRFSVQPGQTAELSVRLSRVQRARKLSAADSADYLIDSDGRRR